MSYADGVAGVLEPRTAALSSLHLHRTAASWSSNSSSRSRCLLGPEVAATAIYLRNAQARHHLLSPRAASRSN
ncbi:hypothetical protein E2562_039316 [Oryza meyeriana var. granulata]|uniref:Uncharacterized protein n=1 Tax=Oryza meyeriana var. granulata TaxID=110450 RepID=A0A6G1E8X5_9ORYZ|nr:hypothetical protein E2562_039316 [Oryza meyeriana var. granulata]